MISHDTLAAALGHSHDRVKERGASTWGRFADWVRAERRSGDSTRGGGLREAKSTERLREEHEDRQASRYHAELDHLTRRICADLRRLDQLIDLANPATPRPAPDAGCRSCARDGGWFEPVWAGRYAHYCRFCGQWRAATHQDPPLAIVRWQHRHPGKRVPVSIVEKAS